MKFSLISCSYNSKKTINDLIDSVTNQDYNNVEHIIIDGTSTDGTLEILKSYKKNNTSVKLISEKDNGVYDALNKGLNLATGDVIGFVHSDDFLNSNIIISEIASIFENNDIHGVYGDLQYVKRNDISKIVRSWKSRPFYPEMIKKAWMPPHPTLFLRKEVYEKHGHFDTSYKISADYEFSKLDQYFKR